MIVRTAIIPAAGLGTRVLPLSKTVPKELLPILDKPAIYYAAWEAHQAGITRLVLVISRGKEAVRDYFTAAPLLEQTLYDLAKWKELASITEPTRWFEEVVVLYQDELKGLGHAVWCARYAISGEHFCIMLPDDIMVCEPPCISQMIEECTRHQADGAVALTGVPPAEVSRYGVVSGESLSDRVLHVKRLVEKPKPDEAPSNQAIMGRYICPPELMAAIGKTDAGAVGEIQLTDALAALAKERKLIGVRYQGERLDAGDMQSYLYTQFQLAAQDAELRRLMEKALREHKPKK
jgi:UTP--glucose-1-phosphate uridylyltransferase